MGTEKHLAQWPQHRREGSWITDESGRSVLAWHVSGGVFNLGFGNEAVARAVADVVTTHDAGYWSMRSQRRDDAERAFHRLLPDDLDRTFFTPSASEAFEVGCKLAKRRTGRPGLVSVTGGYYGAVGYALAMDDPLLQPERYAPLAGPVPKAEFGSIESLEALVDETTAAVCIEAVQVPAGVIEAPAGYLRDVQALCAERGALLLLDEVQGGLFRTGDAWAFEAHDVVPDLLVTGKGLGGGYYPIGALSMPNPSFEVFGELPPLHRSSFCGNEVGAEVASRVAAIYLEEGIGDEVRRKGALLRAGLEVIVADHPETLVELRGRGLLYGIDAASVEVAAAIAVAAWQNDLYVNRLVRQECITIMPTLVTTDEELQTGLERFAGSVDTIARGRQPDR